MKSSTRFAPFFALLMLAGCQPNTPLAAPVVAPPSSFVSHPARKPITTSATRPATTSPRVTTPTAAPDTVVLGANGYNSAAPMMPNPNLTPGDALDVTAADICVRGYSKKVRNVPQSVKEKVYLQYGITSRQKGEYEVDHLISIELSGSNSIRNLWPQSYKTEPWNARTKDKLENYLHERICSGRMDIKQAQREIATDWISAYRNYLGEPGSTSLREETPVVSHRAYRRRTMRRRESSTRSLAAQPPVVYAPPTCVEPPASTRAPVYQPSAPVLQAPAAQTSGQVWVNTNTGVYHFREHGGTGRRKKGSI